jgi:PA14 domain
MLLALTPLIMAQPALGMTKAEYEALLAAAQAKVAAAQIQLKQEQTQLEDLTTSQLGVETSLEQAQQDLEDAQLALNIAIIENNDQGQRVVEATQKLAEAKALVEEKQSDIQDISQNILEQSAVVTQSSLELDEARQAMDLALSNLIDSQESLNELNNTKAQYEEEFSVATTEYNLALLSYNLSVDNVHATGQALETKSNNYNQALATLQQKLDALTQAQAEVDVAQYNYNNNLIAIYPPNSVPTIPGLKADIYKNITSSNPIRSDTAYTFCKTITVTHINKDWGGGDIEGCGGDYVMIHYRGYITVPETNNYEFLAMVDDGWYMTIGGTVVNDNWTLKGCGGNWSNGINLQAGVSYELDAWMYEWGGGACNILYYYTNTNWGVVPAAWFSQNQPTQPTYEYDPALLAILQSKQSLLNTAQSEYTIALATANSTSEEYSNAINEYDAAVIAWQEKQEQLELAEQNKIDKNLSVTTIESLVARAEQTLQQLQVTYQQKELEFLQKETSLLANQQELADLRNSFDNIQVIIDNSITTVAQLQDALDAEAVKKQQTELTVQQQETSVSNNIQLANLVRLELQAVEQKVFTQIKLIETKQETLTKALKELENIPVYEEPQNQQKSQSLNQSQLVTPTSQRLLKT